MNGLLDKYVGWAMLYGHMPDYSRLAHVIGHRDEKHDCLPRRQGRCPGLEDCHDCQWTEGISLQAKG
jgi:hypothetical protein